MRPGKEKVEITIDLCYCYKYWFVNCEKMMSFEYTLKVQVKNDRFLRLMFIYKF